MTQHGVLTRIPLFRPSPGIACQLAQSRDPQLHGCSKASDLHFKSGSVLLALIPPTACERVTARLADFKSHDSCSLMQDGPYALTEERVVFSNQREQRVVST